jgi:ABC-type molybdate transport system permease subunit
MTNELKRLKHVHTNILLLALQVPEQAITYSDLLFLGRNSVLSEFLQNLKMRTNFPLNIS